MTTEQKPLHVRQAEGLRHLADMIEQDAELGRLLGYALRYVQAPTGGEDDPKAAMGRFTRAAIKHGANICKDGSDKWFRVVASWGPVQVEMFGDRDKVCERVVTGTETVTKTVPDPEKLAEVPTVEVTEEIETVEWRCSPLLAAEQAPAVTR